MLPGQNRTGVGKKAFLQTPDSIYQKDPYKDQLSVELQYHNKMHTKSPMHEVDFVPASGTKTMYYPLDSVLTHLFLIWKRSNTLKRKQKRTKVAKSRPNLQISSQIPPQESSRSSSSQSHTWEISTAADRKSRSKRRSYGRARLYMRWCSSPWATGIPTSLKIKYSMESMIRPNSSWIRRNLREREVITVFRMRLNSSWQGKDMEIRLEGILNTWNLERGRILRSRRRVDWRPIRVKTKNSYGSHQMATLPDPRLQWASWPKTFEDACDSSLIIRSFIPKIIAFCSPPHSLPVSQRLA